MAACHRVSFVIDLAMTFIFPRAALGASLPWLRLCGLLYGHYALVHAMVALVLAAAVGAGADYHDAEQAALLLAIPLLLLNFLLTFATRRAGWLVMGLLLAAYAMTQAALLLQDRLLAS